MPGITQFEVQVQQGQRWSIHAQFGSFQKEAAVDEARGLENMPGINGVKVVREVYDPDRGSSQEFIIYKSAGVSSLDAHETDVTSTGSSGRGGGSRWNDDDDNLSATFTSLTDDDAPRKSRKKSVATKENSFTVVIVKLLMVALISLTIAGFLLS